MYEVNGVRLSNYFMPDLAYTIIISFIADPIVAVFHNMAISTFYTNIAPKKYYAVTHATFLMIAILS